MRENPPRLIRISQAVMIQHTLFSLPFAAAALLFETGGVIPVRKVILIFLALFGARNGANALNRLIDHHIDARNKRTENRDLPSGRLERKDLWVFALFCLLLLAVSAYLLNPLCFALLPVALAMIIIYSYTKRFTYLCHYVLGATVAIAPMGTLLALNGFFRFDYFLIAAAVALWVAGFDIIYACQDIEFDREEGLHSIPSRFGMKNALILAALSHAAAWLLFILWGFSYGVGPLYYTGCAVIALLLVIEHAIVAPGKMKHITKAAYHINEAVGVIFFLFAALEVYI